MPKVLIASDELVDFIADCMSRRMRKSDMKKLIRKVAGRDDLHASTYEKIFSLAREELRIRSGRTAEEQRDDAIGLYEQIIADPCASFSAKLEAQREMNILLGIDPRVRTSVQGEEPEDRAKKAREFLRKALDVFE